MTSQKALRADLTAQLEDKGLNTEHCADLVNRYIELWAIGKELKADIKKRGCKVKKLDSKGQEQIVNNESIDQLLKVTSNMLRILETLGLSVPKGSGLLGEGNDPL